MAKNKLNLTKTPKGRRLSDVRSERLRWLWPNRIPLGKLTLLVGNPGVGKSFLTIYMAAQISRGRAWADSAERSKPGTTIILTAEDDIGDTVKIRAEAGGADLSKIIALDAYTTMIVDEETGKSSSKVMGLYDLSKDLDVLIKEVENHPDTRLVVIDPISAYMGGKNSNSNTEVREFLHPLVNLAKERSIAIIGISHLNKNQNAAAAYRTLGSIGFTAAARAVWLVAEDIDEPGRKLLIPSKGNLSKHATGLAFRLMDIPVATPDGMADGAYCAFEPDPIDITADDVLVVPMRDKKRPAKRDKAGEWLQGFLRDGPKKAVEVFYEGDVAGFSEKTLKRAKQQKDIQAIRMFDENGIGHWKWSL